MTGMLRQRLTLALFASLMGCDASFRCDPSPSWSNGPHAVTDAAMPSCTASRCTSWFVATGARHTCAMVGSESEVVCWGANEVGQSDWHALSAWVAPTRVGQRVYPSPYRNIVAGELRTCVEAARQIVCWGGPSPSPEVLPLHYDGHLEVGLEEVCTRAPFGAQCLNQEVSLEDLTLLGGATRVSWRDGAWRIQGVVPGVGLLRDQPTFEMSIEDRFGDQQPNFRRGIAVGALHVCKFNLGEDTRCVGRGDRGQLGTRYLPTDAREGTNVPTPVGPTRDPFGPPFSFLGDQTLCTGGHLGARWTPEGIALDGAHGGHTCRQVYSTDPASNGVFCMGANDRGQLGNGTLDDFNVFTRVEGLPSWAVVEIYCGGEHTCAQTSDALYCWGDNRYSQLGVDPSVMEMSATPIRIDLETAFTTRRL